MKQEIIDIAKKYDADFVGFAPASRFDKDDNIFKIFPAKRIVDMIKKFVSLFLCLITVISVAVPAFAKTLQFHLI